MASLHQRNDTFHISFRFQGKQYLRSLKTSDPKTARAWKANIEETLRDIKRGKIPPPSSGDPAEYILTGGKAVSVPENAETVETLTLKRLFTEYFDSLPEGSREESTLQGMRIHEGHLCRILGEDFDIQTLQLADLQCYVAKRSKEKGRRGRKLTANTIFKAIISLQTAWNWAERSGRIVGAFPRRRDIQLPKDHDKPPFQTFEEITKQIERGGLSKAEQGDLWECLYLTIPEIDEVLQRVKDKAYVPWLYPAVVMAAHTGARRSEILRAEVQDFEGSMLSIRERKRVRGKHSTRRIPISETLRRVIDEWMTDHPGGRSMFCMAGLVRSKNRRTKPESITRDMAHDHLQRALRGSKWSVMAGWHCFRHSMASNLAMQGTDQRVIDNILGHVSAETAKRYQHLTPKVKGDAISQLFKD